LRNVAVVQDVESPRDSHGYVVAPDADAWTGDDGFIGYGNALFQKQACVRCAQVGTIEAAVHAQRLAQAPRTAGQLLVSATPAPSTHGLDTFQGFQRADEHRPRMPLGFGDDVEAMVDAID
jgi:hypothetical protein